MGYLRRVQLYREPAQKPPACAIIISRDASIFVIFRLSVITVGGPCPYHTPSKGEKSQKRASPDDITKQAFCSCFSGPEDAAMLHRPASFDVPKTILLSRHSVPVLVDLRTQRCYTVQRVLMSLR